MIIIHEATKWILLHNALCNKRLQTDSYTTNKVTMANMNKIHNKNRELKKKTVEEFARL